MDNMEKILNKDNKKSQKTVLISDIFIFYDS